MAEKSDQTANAEGNASKGKSLYMTCATCHGLNAEGMQALGAPALADQEPYYLKNQLQNFRTNKRGIHEKDVFGAQMAPMAKILDSEGINDVIAYIKTLNPPKVEATIEGGNVENGMAYYNMVCGACHGPGAVGIESLNSPRLIGMQDWYLERQLNNFRQGIRGKEEGDTFGAQMQQIAESIPDDQTVADLIAYLNSLNAE
jgi:cytochrome c oxidase subunit 2